MYIDTYLPTYIRIYIRSYVRTYVHTYVHNYVHTYIRTCVHTYTQTYIRTYIRTYIHTNIHTYLQRTATLSTNNIKLERIVSKGCPQGSFLRSGLCNILYNSLLNLQFSNCTKVIAFADDLVLLTRKKTVREAGNIANILLSKISA